MKLRLQSWHWLIAYGLLIYLVFLVINLPASMVWSMAPANVKQTVNISNMQGSAWSARADNIVIKGFELGNAEWTVNPFTLVLGQLGGKLKVRHALGQMQTGYDLSADQTIELSNVKSEFSAAILDAAVPPFFLAGSIHSQLDTVQIKGRSLFTATGELEWRDASITGVADVSLGNVTFKASPEAKGTKLQVTNEGGAIEITGDIQVTGNGRYRLNLLLSSRDKRNTDLKNALALLGRVDAQGRVLFNQAGRLPGW